MIKKIHMVFMILIFFASIVFGFDLKIGLNGTGLLPVGALVNGLKTGYGFNGSLYFKPKVLPVGFELESGYLYFSGKIVNDLQIIPLYISGVYNIPLSIFNSFIKLGGGLNFETLKMDEGKMTNIDIGAKIGAGIEYLFLKNFGIRFNTNYFFVYEPGTIGHFIDLQFGFLYLYR